MKQFKFMGSRWVQSWDRIDHHEIFRDKNVAKKIVLLGASYLGERYCIDPPNKPASIENDACLASTVLNLNKDEFSHFKDAKFYQVTMGGTVPQLHLYFLLHLLRTNDRTLKTIIYDGPRKFYLGVHQPDYHALHKALLRDLKTLPADLRSPRLAAFAEKLRAQIDEDEKRGGQFAQTGWLNFKKYLQSKRGWFGEFIAGVKPLLAPESDAVMFKYFYDRHMKLFGRNPVDQYTADPIPLNSEDYVSEPEDFEFLDILVELCKKRGIQLVLYISPSRYYYSWAKKEPFHSKVHQPTMAYLKPKGVVFLDYRSLPFIVPRDTLDGIHPTLSSKLTISRKILGDLNAIQN